MRNHRFSDTKPNVKVNVKEKVNVNIKIYCPICVQDGGQAYGRTAHSL